MVIYQREGVRKVGVFLGREVSLFSLEGDAVDANVVVREAERVQVGEEARELLKEADSLGQAPVVTEDWDQFVDGAGDFLLEVEHQRLFSRDDTVLQVAVQRYVLPLGHDESVQEARARRVRDGDFLAY